MLRWIPYAFIRIVFCFIAGILWAIFFGDYIPVFRTRILCVSLILLYLIAQFVLRRFFFSLNYVLAILGFSAVFFLGYLNLIEHNQRLHPGHLLHEQREISYYTGTIVQPGEERAKTMRYEVVLNKIKTSQGWSQGMAKIYVYVEKKDTLLHYGDRILVKGRPQTISPPRNPGEFDYQSFLSYKNIYHHNFLKDKDFRFIGHSEANPVLTLAYRTRDWTSTRLKKYIKSDREQSIALALILGVKDGLDNDIQHAYAASGAMHVLAVSGLHVGIIYLIILLFFGKLQSTRGGRWGLAGLSLLLLWAYAMITGFSPSVLRAATMFSFIVLARAANRHTNIYNTLAASAFLLLLFDPFLIMSVGFQLSFLAVLGIVYLQPRLYNLFIPKSMVVDKLWGMTTVAVAAQLATFPLGLFYFHQFPGLFFLSNLVVIPGAFMILSGGLLIIATGFIDPLAAFLGQILERFIWVINELIFSLEKVPFSRVEGVHITAVEMWLIMGILLSVLLFFEIKKSRMMYMGLSLAIIFSAVRIHVLQSANQKKITIYSVNNHTAVDFMANGQSFMYTDSILRHDKGKFEYSVQPNHLKSHITGEQWLVEENSPMLKTKYGLRFFDWYGKVLLVLDRELDRDLNLRDTVALDYILVCKDFNLDMAWLRNNFKPGLLVLDGSLPSYRDGDLSSKARELGLAFYSVKQEGAKEILINN